MPDSDDDEELGSGRRTGGGGVVPPALLALIPPKYLGAHLVGDSDAEIARWRQERRRNFPTEGRVAQKRQRDEERSERGQLPGFTGPAGRMGGGVRAQQQRGGARGGAAPRAMPVGGAAVAPPRGSLPLSVGAVAAAAAASAAAAVGSNAAVILGGAAGATGAAADAPPDELPAHAPLATSGGLLAGEGDGEGRGGNEETEPCDDRLGVSVVVGGGAGGAAPPAAPLRPLCHAFAQKGHCRNGSHCRYSHLTGAAAAAAAAAAPASGSIPAACRWYLMGVCAAGARCPYQHALAGAAAGTGAGEAQGLLRKLLARDVQRETSVLLQAVRHLVRTALHPVVDSGGDGRQTAADAGAASGDSGGCAAAALAPSG